MQWVDAHRDGDMKLYQDIEGETVGAVLREGRSWHALDRDGKLLGSGLTLDRAKSMVEYATVHHTEGN